MTQGHNLYVFDLNFSPSVQRSLYDITRDGLDAPNTISHCALRQEFSYGLTSRIPSRRPWLIVNPFVHAEVCELGSWVRCFPPDSGPKKPPCYVPR